MQKLNKAESKEPCKVFATQIATLRKNKGLSQSKVAERLYTTQSQVSKYENGEIEPGIDMLCKFAEFYGVSTDYLLGRAREKPIEEQKQAAAAYTGLSEEALEKLHDWQKPLDFIGQMRNFQLFDELLKDGDFNRLLFILSRIEEESGSLLSQPLQAKEDMEKYMQQDNSCNALCWQMSRILTEIQNKYDERQKQRKKYDEMMETALSNPFGIQGGAENGKH